MIEIDGSMGEGGGQVVRTSLTLAAVLGEPVRIVNIRAGRPRPGLMNQHRAAARAVAKATRGKLEGAKKGSPELVFEPGPVRPGRYSREIGSAGSTTLVLQTMLPVLAAAERRSSLMVHGGTHNPASPPFEFLNECWLPALASMGVRAEAELVLHGFYPKGGGAIRAMIEPWTGESAEFDLAGETEWGEPEVEILIANLPEHVAFREQEEAARSLRLDPVDVRITALPGEVGPGNAVLVRYRAEGRTSLVTAFGEPGKRAERVASEAAREAKKFARSRASVDPRLADQLLLWLALGPGGRFSTSETTEHFRTQARVIEKFLGDPVRVETVRPDFHVVEARGSRKPPMGSS